MSKFIMVSLLSSMVLWSLKAQTTYTDYLWHNPETYAQHKVGGFTLHYNSPPDNPQPESKGVAFGDYTLNSKGNVQWASLAKLNYGQWNGSKDSIVFIHSQDTLTQQKWSTYLVYRDEKSIDFTYPEMPQFEAYSEEDMTKKVEIYDKGKRLVKSYTDYNTTYYRYNSKGQLLSKEVVNPEREEMGMGGRTLKLFNYNNEGLLEKETEIRPIPGTDKTDTLIAQYQYDTKGRLIQKIPASPIFKSSDTTFYEYGQGLLALEKTRQNTHIRREPVTYQFETHYIYEEGLLKEKKKTRDGELETWEQYTYYPNGLVHQKKNLRLDTGEPVEILTWEYRFTNK
ncbi:MAG: hypothetical protein AAF519_08300 [Bacteroidota bacterium]